MIFHISQGQGAKLYYQIELYYFFLIFNVKKIKYKKRVLRTQTQEFGFEVD